MWREREREICITYSELYVVGADLRLRDAPEAPGEGDAGEYCIL